MLEQYSLLCRAVASPSVELVQPRLSHLRLMTSSSILIVFICCLLSLFIVSSMRSDPSVFRQPTFVSPFGPALDLTAARAVSPDQLSIPPSLSTVANPLGLFVRPTAGRPSHFV